MDRLGAIKRGDEPDDPDWGRVPVDSTIELRGRFVQGGDDGAGRPAGRGRPRSPPTTRCSCRRSSAPRSSRASRSTTSPASSTRRRCSATSGSYRPEDGENDDEFKDAHPADAARGAGQGEGRPACSCPQVVYGYFPANGDGDDLVIWTDETRTAERARFHVPPPAQGRRSSASPTSSGRSTATRSTTPPSTSSRWARRSREATAKLFADDRYQEYLLLHGLGVEMAEALAELLAPAHPRGVGLRRRGRPDAGRPVPPAVPRRPLLVGLPGLPRPRGQRHGPRAARRRPHRPRVRRGDRLPVPARADHLGAHLPPPPGQVLRRPLTDGGWAGWTSWRPRRSGSCGPTTGAPGPARRRACTPTSGAGTPPSSPSAGPTSRPCER